MNPAQDNLANSHAIYSSQNTSCKTKGGSETAVHRSSECKEEEVDRWRSFNHNSTTSHPRAVEVWFKKRERRWRIPFALRHGESRTRNIMQSQHDRLISPRNGGHWAAQTFRSCMSSILDAGHSSHPHCLCGFRISIIHLIGLAICRTV